MRPEAELAVSTRRRWLLCLLMFLIGLLLGVYVGYRMAAARAYGSCFDDRGRLLADGVSQEACIETCPTSSCSWRP